MGFGLVQRNLSPIGIDFGSDSIKLLQMIRDDPPKLVAAAAMDIPMECRQDPATFHGFVEQALRELMREGKFKGRRAVASIPAAHTYVQHLRLPRSEDDDLALQIEAELRGKLPLDPTAMVIRHARVGEVMADGGAKQEVVCLAASRDAVMRHVQTAKRSKINVVGMHSEPMAILQAFAHLHRRAGDEQRTTFFVDIGAKTTKALIAHGGALAFAKNIQVAGEHFIRQFATEQSIAPSEARLERIRHATDKASEPKEPPQAEPPPVPEMESQDQRESASSLAMIDAVMESEADDTTGGAPEAATAQPGPARAVAAAPAEQSQSEMLDCLVDELQLCLGYHQSLFPDRPVEKLVFLGGESRHVDMCQRIARALRLPAQLGDPLARVLRSDTAQPPVGVDLRQPQPGWAVPLGLCLLPTNL